MAITGVTGDPLDPTAELARLETAGGDAGALVTFTGLVRGKPGDVLELEHYPGMTERQIAAIAAEAERRWPLTACLAIHRYGRLAVGEPIVLVATAAAHRGDAFAAAEFLMDWLKTKAPFWKREDGPQGARWVDARVSDDAAARRWARAGRTG